LFILIGKKKNFICHEVFFVSVLRDFFRSLFIMARFINPRKLEMF